MLKQRNPRPVADRQIVISMEVKPLQRSCIAIPRLHVVCSIEQGINHGSPSTKAVSLNV